MAIKKAAAKRYSSKATQLTFATLDTKRGYRLGIRTERGVLDVELAAKAFRVKAPVTIEEVISGADCAPLKMLVDKALADSRANKALVPESRARFGPAVPNPGKIICVGLNYRQHAQETGNPI